MKSKVTTLAAVRLRPVRARIPLYFDCSVSNGNVDSQNKQPVALLAVHCLDVLKTMPKNAVEFCVTSPHTGGSETIRRQNKSGVNDLIVDISGTQTDFEPGNAEGSVVDAEPGTGTWNLSRQLFDRTGGTLERISNRQNQKNPLDF